MSSLDWTIRFKGYLPIDHRMEDRLRRVVAEIDRVPASALHIDEDARVITVDYRQVRGWLEASRQAVSLVRAGRGLVVKPPWEAYEPAADEVVVEIDAGEVFGTGLHQTTRLCLAALEQHVRPGGSVVDFGAGSGVLAIAAAKLGACRVTAIEGDPEAAEIARANVSRNRVDETVDVAEALSTDCVAHPADLVVANIIADTVVAHMAGLSRVTDARGKLIVSGFNKSNSKPVEEALVSAGFDILETLDEEGWLALVAGRQQ